MPQMSPMWWSMIMATLITEMNLIKSLIYFNWGEKKEEEESNKNKF